MGRIYRTPVYKADLRRIYQHSLRHFGEVVADETMRQIQAAEMAALDPLSARTDADYHSRVFLHINIRNSQTLFYYRIGDDVVMITAGYCGRDWKAILARVEDDIIAQIDKIMDQK